MTRAFSHPSRRAALGLVAGALAWPRVALANGFDTLSGGAFGTHWRLVAQAGQDLARLGPEIATLLETFDRRFSPWRPDSDLSRFNAAPSGALADSNLVDVATAALDIAARSDGAFDPTVGPLVARRGFGPILEGGKPDWRGLVLGAGRLRKSRADLTLDLCGIAKGRALDAIATLLRDAGTAGALLDLGGEFVAIGQHPDGRDWRVGVEAPMPLGPAPAALRLPDGVAVATSGTRTQSYTFNGKRLSHIIGTDAAAGAAHRSVTVIAEDAMTADGWATALCAAGPGDGPALARSQGIAALFLTERDAATLQDATGAMPDFLI